MVLLIDNYDSFTHNLARYFSELGQEVVVKRNDEITAAQVRALKPEYLVFSPGPCTPDKSGVCLELVKVFSGQVPLLGVCLGHQVIGQVNGADIVRARQIMHGKTSCLYHSGGALFEGIPNEFLVTRYHSLVIKETSLPSEFNVTAWCETPQGEREVMAIEHNAMAVCGVQFHPESVMTEFGHQLLGNFLQNYR